MRSRFAVASKPHPSGRRTFAVLLVAGVNCWLYARQLESTDDAYMSQVGLQTTGR